MNSEAIAGKGRIISIGALLLVLVFLVFGQTIHDNFVNYDDSWYVYDNPRVTAGLTPGGTVRAFERKDGGLWTPLVMISHMADWQLYRAKAGLHHLTNLILHLASTILLFLLLAEMTGAVWRSGFVAALFAIHPLHVESVAWISERKDMLSGLFFMLTLWAYIRYARRPQSVLRYLAVIVPFALGLMCKPMLVTMPFVLLLLDYWPLRRLFSKEKRGWPIDRRVILEKLPLLLLSIVICVVTMAGPGEITAVDSIPVPFWTRMAEAPVWIATYLVEMVWPSRLAVIYTHYEESFLWWPSALALCLFVTVGTFLLRRKQPWLWMGWLWNVGMLTPVLGIVQITRHARADHYNYLPQIGLYIGVTWMVANWAGERRPRRIALGIGAAATVCALSFVAWRQATFWRDSIALWTHALECTRDNLIAHDSLANALIEAGRVPEAIAEYEAALRINPGYSEAHNNLGSALLMQGRLAEAEQQLREAVRLNPTIILAHNNLGRALLLEGRTAEAIAEFRMALDLYPSFADACKNLGKALFQNGSYRESLTWLTKAHMLDPGDLDTANDLAWALAVIPDPALRDAKHSLELARNITGAANGSRPTYLRTLAAAQAESGDFSGAAQTAETALQMTGSNAPLAGALRRELALYQAGRALGNAR